MWGMYRVNTIYIIHISTRLYCIHIIWQSIIYPLGYTISRADYHLCAKRILELSIGEKVSRMTFRSTKNPSVSILKSWCNFRKWKNIMLQELSARNPNKLGIWRKNSEGCDCLNRSVWSKFKKDHCITEAKWVKFYQVAPDSWLNKKRLPNNKFLEPPPTCERLL
jgi:hypothetical protein